MEGIDEVHSVRLVDSEVHQNRGGIIENWFVNLLTKEVLQHCIPAGFGGRIKHMLGSQLFVDSFAQWT